MERSFASPKSCAVTELRALPIRATSKLVKRVYVVGNSGSGKSTFAKAMATAIGAEWIELDALFHLPNWQELPDDEFRTAVDAATSAPSWVVDGNYSAVRETVVSRADTIVWLDYPRSLTTRRVWSRTLRRAVRRETLWNGNREAVRNMLDPRPRRNILLWSATAHGMVRRRYEAALADGVWSHATVHRLTHPSEAEALLEFAQP